VLGLLERLLEAARERVAARFLRLHGLIEQRVAPRLLVGQDPVGLVELRLVGPFGFDMPNDALQALVDNERRLTARTHHLVLGSELSHRGPLS
jgi:hypothetical protein